MKTLFWLPAVLFTAIACNSRPTTSAVSSSADEPLVTEVDATLGLVKIEKTLGELCALASEETFCSVRKYTFSAASELPIEETVGYVASENFPGSSTDFGAIKKDSAFAGLVAMYSQISIDSEISPLAKEQFSVLKNEILNDSKNYMYFDGEAQFDDGMDGFIAILNKETSEIVILSTSIVKNWEE